MLQKNIEKIKQEYPHSTTKENKNYFLILCQFENKIPKCLKCGELMTSECVNNWTCIDHYPRGCADLIVVIPKE